MRSAFTGGRRRSIRLSSHDYAGNAGYLITLCTHKRAHLFGNVLDDRVQLSPVGQLVHDLWVETANIRRGVTLDAFIFMPNHMHAIVLLSNVGTRLSNPGLVRPPRSLGSLIAGYKSACTSKVNDLLGTKGLKVWQRNYHDRVIRDERALYQIRRYIATNPVRWVPHRRWVAHA
jgi:putative transposase